MDKDTIDAIMSEVGPLVEAGEVTSYEGDGPDVWILDFEDEPVCQIESIGEHGRHLLSGAIAPVPQNGQLELFRTLLLLNDQVETTGGIRMAIDGPDGDVVMAIDLDADQMEPQALSQAIIDFRVFREGWTPVLESWTEDGGAVPDLPVQAGAPGIRV